MHRQSCRGLSCSSHATVPSCSHSVASVTTRSVKARGLSKRIADSGSLDRPKLHATQPPKLVETSTGTATRITGALGTSSPVFGRSPSAISEHRPMPSPGVSQVLTSSLIAQASEKSLEELLSPKLSHKVAYQGVPGAYSEVAARKACPDMDPLPCELFEVAFQALSQWMCSRAVLPIENSLGGSIHAVYDLLLRYGLHIVGETSLAINHCLVALPGTKKEDIRRVMSHPQALAQCTDYLSKLGVVREEVADTAGAAQQVAQQKLVGVGAICSRRGAELYGLDVIEEGIQDVKDNITRFIVLSRDPLLTSPSDAASTAFKTSIVFSLHEGPGQLYKALSVFALWDIDMTKIESRPMRANPLVVRKTSSQGAPASSQFNYLFYVDIVGGLADARVQNAVRNLQDFAPFVRVLGSYPMDTELGYTSCDEFHKLKASAAAAGK